MSIWKAKQPGHPGEGVTLDGALLFAVESARMSP